MGRTIIVSQNTDQEKPPDSSADDLRQEIHQISSLDVYRNALNNLVEHQGDIERFIGLKWRDIKSEKRIYGLSPGKKYEIQVSINVLRHMGISVLEFCQSDTNHGAVDVNFVMRTNVNFYCVLEASGDFRIDDQLMNLFPVEFRSGYRLLLQLVTIAYYADLVIPMESERRTKNFIESAKESKSIIPGQTVTKYIPRLIGSRPTECGRNGPTKASSFVDPHRRRLPPGQKPSFYKIIEADQFGINLHGPSYPTVQYTFVEGHARGGDHPPDYLYKQDYRAVRSLESILDILGFLLLPD